MAARPDLAMRLLRVEGIPSFFTHPRHKLNLLTRLLKPFCCAEWDMDEKIERICDHYNNVERLGGILKATWGQPRLLTTLSGIGDQYSVKLDEPRWMLGDGLSTISLWYGIDRMFSVTFTLSNSDDGLVSYIGGLQGRGGVVDLFRKMTKDANGLRPRDLAIELHRMLCAAIGVTHIYAVAENARSHRDDYFGADTDRFVSHDYDAAWIDRGGCRTDLNWFEMPVASARRGIEDIPARKRSLYRQRYAMLDQIEADIAAAVTRHGSQEAGIAMAVDLSASTALLYPDQRASAS